MFDLRITRFVCKDTKKKRTNPDQPTFFRFFFFFLTSALLTFPRVRPARNPDKQGILHGEVGAMEFAYLTVNYIPDTHNGLLKKEYISIYLDSLTL